MISLSHITLRAGTFHLRDLSLEIPAGSHTGLRGRTGSGKTTLLEGLCGLRPVLAGSVRIGGRDVTHLPPGGRGIGLVPQDGALFDHLLGLDPHPHHQRKSERERLVGEVGGEHTAHVRSPRCATAHARLRAERG